MEAYAGSTLQGGMAAAPPAPGPSQAEGTDTGKENAKPTKETPAPSKPMLKGKGANKGGGDGEGKKSKQESEVKELERKLKALGKELFAERKANAAAEKEREKLTLELVRVNTVKGKLEELSRELQRQNKLIQDESKRSAVEEASRREELSAKFQDAVGDIHTRLASQSDEHSKQLSENNELRKKLIDFAERMEAREAMHAKTLEAKSLECQLHEKRVEQEEHRVAEANLKVDAYMQQCEFLVKTEEELRSQLTTYRDKFDGFQQMLTQSHDAFTTFKVDMEKMAKQIKKLRKENEELIKKSHASDVALIASVDDKAALLKRATDAEAKTASLESLCRTLQAERKASKQESQPAQ